MKTQIALFVAASFGAAAIATAALSQTAKKPAPALRQPTAAPKTGAPQDQGFGFDDLMTMLVQPRHIKLFQAGAKKNWELAAAESRDLRASFGRIALVMPKYDNNDVSLAMGNFMGAKLDVLDAAIAAANAEQFATAYKAVTAGCNDCHTYMEHPFLVIQNPDPAASASAHSDQDFKASP